MVRLPTLQFLKKHKVTVPPWPPVSPDLNPIENIWSIMKDRVRKQQPSNALELVHTIKNAWRATPDDVIQRTVASFLERLRAVARAKGKSTHF